MENRYDILFGQGCICYSLLLDEIKKTSGVQRNALEVFIMLYELLYNSYNNLVK